MVAEVLAQRQAVGILADVGCGAGNLWPFVSNRFAEYIGVDAVRYEGFPPEVGFCQVDLDGSTIALADESVDVVAAVEVIEHLENPRAFMRELVRLVNLVVGSS